MLITEAINRYIEAVCRTWYVPPGDLCGPCRKLRLVEARAAVMWLLRERLALTQKEIGQALGGRDHATVFHHLRKVRERVALSPRFDEWLKAAQVRAEVDAIKGGGE